MYILLQDYVNKKEGETVRFHPSLGANLVAKGIAAKVDESGELVDNDEPKNDKIPSDDEHKEKSSKKK